MTVKKLKELLKDVPDEMMVLIPARPTEGFDGCFLSPCTEDTDVIEMAGNETMTEEDVDRAENLGTLQKEKAFVIVPCGFYEEHDDTHTLN